MHQAYARETCCENITKKSEHDDKRHTSVLYNLAICPRKGFKYGANYLEKVTIQHTEKYNRIPDKKTICLLHQFPDATFWFC
jgi:hypothetical protein